ncbi:MAG: hypothetical protein HN704_00835 [Bacteroidetes bacterium]|jgi:hypothetical protein|nr:hypothetical protein [Bacteroidota bacterium]MBT3463521.1 hypothetical protein [archaeon]MBT6687395.1 hypothetical protein [Bacteroidota bacterium]MBT7142601.1 hypothetical protein [Bacteroidota bacterium]MBT7490130.1 hypothetical protein [Bacteroidota bacterium]
MLGKFSLEDIIIKVLPGGFFLAILYYLYGQDFPFELSKNFDFLYTFVFFCIAFITGEILQTLAHQLEKLVDIFFKLRRPSEVFLYANNPVLKNKNIRIELLDYLKLTKEQSNIFSIYYCDLPFLKFWKINKEDNAVSQSIFWRLYSNVSENEEVKTSNRGYLFVRVIVIVFLILGICFFIESNVLIGLICALLFWIFLWRCRGYARGLVFKVVLLNLKLKFNEKNSNI